MIKEKQIEEIKKIMIKTCKKARTTQEDYLQDRYAEALYNAGYRKVVICDNCYLQGSCIVEDAFNTARMADSMKFCAVGKQKRSDNL